MTIKIEAAPIFILTTTGVPTNLCHNITRVSTSPVSTQPACQVGDGSSLYSSGGTSRAAASQAEEAPSALRGLTYLPVHYGGKGKSV